jgi:hypothetical protein
MQKSSGFNYAYRRSSTPSTVAPTPNSNTSALPGNTTNPPLRGSIPNSSERPVPPQISSSKPSPPTSPPPNGKDLSKEGDTVNAIKANGAPPSSPSDKVERERAKRKDKKDKKDKERADRDAKEREGTNENDVSEPPQIRQPAQVPKSGKSTPVSEAPPPDISKETESELKSPAAENAGVRTPTSRKPSRNPWTLFMRMTVSANESELREFFGEAKSGVSNS